MLNLNKNLKIFKMKHVKKIINHKYAKRFHRQGSKERMSRVSKDLMKELRFRTAQKYSKLQQYKKNTNNRIFNQ